MNRHIRTTLLGLCLGLALVACRSEPAYVSPWEDSLTGNSFPRTPDGSTVTQDARSVRPKKLKNKQLPTN